jgi:predicted phosphodiesterase
LIGYAPDPNKVFPILQDPEHNIQTIVGNYDEGVAFEKQDCGCGYTDLTSSTMGRTSYEWTLKHTSKENKVWIRNLKRKLRLKLGNKRVLMVHGSPRNISERVDLLSDREILEFMENVDVLFCAHTHIPYHRIINNKHVINSGSVGRPRIGSPQASYAIITIGITIGVNFRFIDYDFESFALEIENSDMPKNNFAEVIRTGYWKF